MQRMAREATTAAGHRCTKITIASCIQTISRVLPSSMLWITWPRSQESRTISSTINRIKSYNRSSLRIRPRTRGRKRKLSDKMSPLGRLLHRWDRFQVLLLAKTWINPVTTPWFTPRRSLKHRTRREKAPIMLRPTSKDSWRLSISSWETIRDLSRGLKITHICRLHRSPISGQAWAIMGKLSLLSWYNKACILISNSGAVSRAIIRCTLLVISSMARSLRWKVA